MRKRFTSGVLALAAMLAMLAGRVPVAARAHAWTLNASLKVHSAAKQLPRGFVLPSSDVDLKVSSLVAADVDADGDLDIVAAGPSEGSFGIVVWVNDGAGRLTRKRPRPPKTLGSVPPSPSVDQHESAGGAPIQPDSPAVQTVFAKTPLVLPAGRRPIAASHDAASATLATLRSRAPPVLS